MVPFASKTAVCGSSALPSGILYSVTAPECGSSLPIYPLAFPVNQMLPLESATSPCGPESSIFSAYSLKLPVLGSTRPILFCICSVNHSAPSPPTAGSCGCAPLVGTSHSLMVTLSSPTRVALAGAGFSPSPGAPLPARTCAEARTTSKTPQLESNRQRIVTFALFIAFIAASYGAYRGVGASQRRSLGPFPMVILCGVQREGFFFAATGLFCW